MDDLKQLKKQEDQITKSEALNTSLEPVAVETQKPYVRIKQTKHTNELLTVRTTDKNTDHDTIANTYTTRAGKFELFFDETLYPFNTNTIKLLIALSIEYTQTNSKRVKLSLKDYVDRLGLKDKKEARKKIKQDLKALFFAYINYYEKEGEEPYQFKIIQAQNNAKNDIIEIVFADDFLYLYDKPSIGFFPITLLKINGHKNPYSMALGNKLANHKRMNYGKSNENTISVKKLLEACVNMPTYEDVKNTDRAYKRRIIEPFERDLEALIDYGTITEWYYTHRNNIRLTDEELNSMDYDKFIKLNICFHLKYYPNLEEELKKK